MILFKPEHKPMIIHGEPRWKTQTRRKGQRRWKIDSIHKCYTNPPFSGGKPFALVKIIGVREEQLKMLSWEGALNEGYESREAYFEAYERIYRITDMEAEMHEFVWVVDFELIEAYE